MMLAATSPHGLGAWIVGLAPFVAATASTVVAIIALRLARQDKATEENRELTKARAAARQVAVAYDQSYGGWEPYGVEGRDPSEPPCVLVKVTGTLTNKSGSAIHGIAAGAWVSAAWAMRAGPGGVDTTTAEVSPIPLQLPHDGVVAWTVRVVMLRHADRPFEVPVRREVTFPIDDAVLSAAYCDVGLHLSWSDSDERRWTRAADGPTDPMQVNAA